MHEVRFYLSTIYLNKIKSTTYSWQFMSEVIVENGGDADCRSP